MPTGNTEQQIDAGGLRITTTIDRGYQDAAVDRGEHQVIADLGRGPAGASRGAGVGRSEDRAVLAYYGGATKATRQPDFNDYAQAQRQPGSSVKPYVLATALEQNVDQDGQPRIATAAIGRVPRPHRGRPLNDSGAGLSRPRAP